jgi:hypothetical protein
MGEIVNLNRAKKQRGRQEAARVARENRVRHGRTGAQKENDRREEQRRRDALDGKRPLKE